ncbi:cytochrome c class I [Terriglobus saanensis SP1PR4]|uniref:Cytochrome c class I n=2 Tax=Terriglobus saanensis TaxID=870903 RepID=E8UZY8_TERSS|nr:cytochrome c class I [Terriglobus saanensis SP1PR4]
MRGKSEKMPKSLMKRTHLAASTLGLLVVTGAMLHAPMQVRAASAAASLAPRQKVAHYLRLAAALDALGQQKSATPTPAPPAGPASVDVLGAQVYEDHCAICHGEKREGILPSFPPLIGVSHRYDDAAIIDRIRHGRGRMPAFPKLSEIEIGNLLHFMKSGEVIAVNPTVGSTATLSPLLENGKSLFQQNCSFCHGRDAGGGETGPDLTRSKLVNADVNGDKISEVIHNGRPPRMPRFSFSENETAGVVAYVHSIVTAAQKEGRRRGVDVSDLQTGNVDAGKKYFNGAGGCASCHSPTGDLKGIATRYEGLQLEQRMLYPRGTKVKASVTLPSGEKVAGTISYLDEFTIAITDASGTYRSWPRTTVKENVEKSLQAHVDQFPKYTDDDIHNLMAYLQTMR